MKDYIRNILKDSEVIEWVNEIEEVYNELKEKESEFLKTFSIKCKENCGECCKAFNPDITYVEAIYLAYGIIESGRVDEILEVLEKNKERNGCPLYDSVKHCIIYEYRPLICRLFNASASNDKNGNYIFRKCKWNDTFKEFDNEILKKQKEKVVSMEEFGQRIEELIPGSYDTKNITEMIINCIYKIELLLSIKEESNKE